MRDNTKDTIYMSAAIDAARECESSDDVPVGAVIVRHGKIIARGCNSREKFRDATCHAETEAIREACRALGGWHLTDCELYVTLEPCPMCAGAIANARIDTVVIGAKEPKSGAYGSAADFLKMPLNHTPEVVFGVMEEECSSLLRDFFKKKRERGKRFRRE